MPNPEFGFFGGSKGRSWPVEGFNMANLVGFNLKIADFSFIMIGFSLKIVDFSL